MEIDNEKTPLRFGAKNDSSKESWQGSEGTEIDYLKKCYESNVYTRIATTEEGSLFQGMFIAFLQLFIPIRIIIDNRENYENCDMTDGISIMSWDTVIIGTALIYLLWTTIINDTMKSMRGMDFCIGLEKLPRKWAVYVGMIVTPVTNCSTGFAASCMLLTREMNVVDVTKDCMALFFINRLDEDFGGFHSIYGVMKRRLGWINPKDDIIYEDANDLLTEYGPFQLPSSQFSILFYKLVYILEFVVFVSSIIIPFVYFGCAM